MLLLIEAYFAKGAYDVSEGNHGYPFITTVITTVITAVITAVLLSSQPGEARGQESQL
jgi:hypothetical protein